MNCYYHREHVAIGVCKNCQRGLCPECAAEVTNGIACLGRCEQMALLLNDAVLRSTQFMGISAWIFIALGVAAFLTAGVISGLSLLSEEPAFALLIFCAPLWLISLICFWAGFRLRGKSRTARSFGNTAVKRNAP